MPTTKQVENKLYDVMDPELDMSIMDLGLVYKVTVNKTKVHIKMTLTSLGCPLFDTIQEEINHKVSSLGVKEKDIEIELTFDPPWSMDQMSEKAKATLGI
ncbi:aromatic ring hydroxylase [Candidatus Roizmanbacteria bacterium CG_4_9_14_0_2_um_filter_39_13]|uniref:Aromatic ring hydroxylase n=2 Tax=Candidatus Roizmaniibacteriota TaxID=1752723 RepID=A0A2M8F029_9BACT|nr:MAG: aromatic ring hydroxylase [Candidatus Roizmanbacteria bacterium CG_4_10_14_0_2_um_filter_39_12]PJC32644.1 MAG: aromatic ring hydroxylase [Candidatus Roizmanbacteria bacterium CG_4_9_14_0_2_um_filter_39_13]PJE61701.1 MAG: aromatic ring hydroxylase [Candidatus Roizmanbacteria bacterium CG10_big_fil_rev_8_21_14_0_10_39_12]